MLFVNDYIVKQKQAIKDLKLNRKKSDKNKLISDSFQKETSSIDTTKYQL